MEIVLPACPFCGRKAEELIKGYSCQCSNESCLLHDPMDIDVWCRRPIEDNLQSQLSKYEKIINDTNLCITSYDEKLSYIANILNKIAVMPYSVVLKDGTVINSGELALDGLEKLRY